MRIGSRIGSRRAVGTLLIIVLVILTSLFIMAMMQFFAGTVTRGKRLLHEIAVTDFMSESAVEEAVSWFKGSVNGVGQPISSDRQKADIEQFHKALLKNGTAPPDLKFKPTKTIALYQKFQQEAKADDVVIALDHVDPMFSGPQKNTFYESRGIVSFTATVKFRGTVKTAARALEYRQAVILPPKEFRDFAFVAIQWNYLLKRLSLYYTDFDAFKESLGDTVKKIYFGLKMVWYIVEPDAQNDQPGPTIPYKVGIYFAQQVKAKINQNFSGQWGAGMSIPALSTDLNRWASYYGNSHFSPRYLYYMAESNTNELAAAVNELKNFGFQPSSATLALSDDYPLSTATPKQKTSDIVNQYQHPSLPLQGWGLAGKLKDDKLKEADFQFDEQDEKGNVKKAPAGRSLMADPKPPYVVIPGTAAKAGLSLDQVKFFLRPPPIFPKKDSTPVPTDIKDPAQNTEATYQVDTSKAAHLADVISGTDIKELQEEMNKDRSKYEVPGVFIAHPKTHWDWAFRLPEDDYKNKFADRKKQVTDWVTAVDKAVKSYNDDMGKAAQDLTKSGVKLFRRSGAPTSAPAAPAAPTGTPAPASTGNDVLTNTTEVEKKASFRFKSVDEFKAALQQLQEQAEVQCPGTKDKLVLNGVFFIEGAAPGGSAAALEITPQKYCGQGTIVAPEIKVSNSLEKADPSGKPPSGNLVLWSTSNSKPFEFGGTIEATVMTGGPLKSNGGTIKGCLVVADTPCKEAVSRGKTDEDSEAKHYYYKLPPVTLKYPDDYGDPAKLIHFSHFTFTPYRIAGGGRRG